VFRPEALEDLYAYAFKVTHDIRRGPLVYLRLYSGSLAPKTTVYNLSQKNRLVKGGRLKTTVLEMLGQDYPLLQEHTHLPHTLYIVQLTSDLWCYQGDFFGVCVCVCV